ncbi:MAG TPA: hypothetical protein PK490_15940 [Prosthecobacter sp.]|nr:hypothetical protein [Prosthecobacter sp.]HRK15774.1 hypothetical protein [Prosthecobacter sp.]
MIRRFPPAHPASHQPQEQDGLLHFDSAPEFGSGTHDDDLPAEDMEKQVRETQERLARLRDEQEAVEREQQMLESLKQKKERFGTGRKEVMTLLEQHLRTIGHDLEQARRHVEDLAATENDFREHLEHLKNFLPERWQRGNIMQEMDRALAVLEEAEAALETGILRIAAHQPRQAPPPARSWFRSRRDEEMEEDAAAGHSAAHYDLTLWAWRGLAFTLPLIIAMLLGLVLAKFMF